MERKMVAALIKIYVSKLCRKIVHIVEVQITTVCVLQSLGLE